MHELTDLSPKARRLKAEAFLQNPTLSMGLSRRSMHRLSFMYGNGDDDDVSDYDNDEPVEDVSYMNLY
jgi:hypothetical protein